MILAAGGLTVVVTGVTSVINKLRVYMASQRRAHDILWGKAADPKHNLPRTPGIMEQFLPNGGSSLVDRINTIHDEVVGMRAEQTAQREILDEHILNEEVHQQQLRLREA